MRYMTANWHIVILPVVRIRVTNNFFVLIATFQVDFRIIINGQGYDKGDYNNFDFYHIQNGQRMKSA